MKKLLLGLGTLASVAAPVAAVVACGSSTPEAKFETATPEQETAVTAVTTKITPLAGGLPKTSTEISGNKVRYTFGAVPAAAEASDDASTVTAKTYVVKTFTVDLESGKIIDAQAAEADGKFESIIDSQEVKDAAGDITSASETAKTALEQANADAALAKAKLDGEAKVETISGLSDADKNKAKAAITAATDQAGIDQAVNEAKASVTPAPAQPQAGSTGNIVDKDQDAVDAEQLVINALTPVSIDAYDSAADAPNGILTTVIATGLGLTSFTPKDGFTYSITDSTATTVTITVGSEAHAAIEGTPVAITLVIKATPVAGNTGNPSGPDAGKTAVPGAGAVTNPGAPAAVTKVADAYDDSTKTVSVTIDVDADDFQNHIAGEAALAIQTVMAGKDIADIEHVTITINDGTTTETNTADVATQTATSNTPATAVKQKLNGAINDAAEQDAEADLSGHDMATTADDYATTMVTRIKAVVATTTDFNFANKILEAIGNATRFNSATEIQTVFGTPTTITPLSVKVKLEKMLKAGVFGTLDPTIVAELTAQFAKITD